MRVSVDKDDKGYSPYAHHVIDKVYLNGVELTHIVTADDEAGLVVFYCTDDEGKYLLDDDEKLVTGTLTGDVEIVFKEGFGVLDLHRIH